MAGFELPERFWNKVGAPDSSGCRFWQACRNADGYGEFFWRGKKVRVHRLLLESRGIYITGIVARHKCDNPPCVEFAHLLAGTHADNVRDRDMRNRGRWIGKKGASNPNAKLTIADVTRLRGAYSRLKRHRSGRLINGELNKLRQQFKYPRGTIRNIVEKYQWTEV